MISDNESLAFEEEDGGSFLQSDLAIPGPAVRHNSSAGKGGSNSTNFIQRPPLHTPVSAGPNTSSDAAESKGVDAVKRSLNAALTHESSGEKQPLSSLLSRIVKRGRADSVASNASSIMFQESNHAGQSPSARPQAASTQNRAATNDSIAFTVAEERSASPPLVPQARGRGQDLRSSPEQSISFQIEHSPVQPTRHPRNPAPVVAASNDSIVFQSIDPVRRSPVPITNDSIAFQVESKARETPVGVTNDSIAFQFDDAEEKLNATDNNLEADKKRTMKPDRQSSPGASMSFMPLADNMPSMTNDSIAFQIDDEGSPDSTVNNVISQRDLAQYRRSPSAGSRRHGNRRSHLYADAHKNSPEAEQHIVLESSAELNNTVGSSESNRDNNELVTLLGKPPALLQTKSLHIDDPITFSGAQDNDDDGLSPGIFSSTRITSKNSSTSDRVQVGKAASPHRKATKKTIVSNHLKNTSNRSSPAMKNHRHALLAQAASRLKEADPGRAQNSDDDEHAAATKSKLLSPPSPPQAPPMIPRQTPPVNMPKKRSDTTSPSMTRAYDASSMSSQDVDMGPPQRQFTERDVSTHMPGQTDITHTPRESHSGSDSAVLQHLEDQETQNQFHQRELHRRKSASVRAGQATERSNTPTCGSPVHKRVITMPFDGSNPSTAPMSPLELSKMSRARKAAKHNAALAEEETKYWHVFNDQQRKELQQLTGVIAAAKRQDRTILDVARREQPTTAATAAAVREESAKTKAAKAGGYAAALCQLKGSAPAAREEAPRPYPQQKHQPSPRMTSASQKSTPRPASRGAAAKQKGAPRTNPAAFPSHIRPQETEKRQQSPPPKAPKTTDAASVAALLGIQWPPPAPRQLYFVNGTRLTAAQTAKFNEMVQVEADAAKAQQQYEHNRLAHHLAKRDRRVLSPSKLREPSAASGVSPLDELYAKCAVKPKQTNTQQNIGSRRSQTLREVFDFLDVNGSHMLRAVDLPVLKNLLEDEIKRLEPLTRGDWVDERAQERRGGPSDPLFRRRGSIQAQMTLLEEARACQSLHRHAWNLVSRARSSSSARRDSDALEWEDEDQALERRREVKQAQAVRKALLRAFIVNIVIPLLLTSCINTFDFSTFCVIIFASINGGSQVQQVGITEEGKAWRLIVNQYFEVLGS